MRSVQTTCRLLFVLFIVVITASAAQGQGIYRNWGMTSEGGTDSIGVIFSTDSSGGNLVGRHSFTYINKGAQPSGFPMTPFNGKLYGFAGSVHYANGSGLIYEYDPVTGSYTAKATVPVAAGYFSSVEGLTVYNNQLYGVNADGGPTGQGELFKYDPVANTYTGLYDFDNSTGSDPVGKLLLFNNKLYGLADIGGQQFNGVLFEFDPATNVYTKKVELRDEDGAFPQSSLVAYNNKIYGMTTGGGIFDAHDDGQGTLFEYDPVANTITNKVNFTQADGRYPAGGLLVYGNKLWGTTIRGGANDSGVVFQYDPNTNIYTKKIDMVNATGGSPYGDLVVSGNKLLGLTAFGGANNSGVLFEYDTLANTYTKRVDFLPATGKAPYGTLTIFNDTAYGVTSAGGSADEGVLFSYNPVTFQYTKKIDFEGSDGDFPIGGLTYYNKSLYGCTSWGGTNGTGVLFRYDLATNTTTTEMNFDTLSGKFPQGDLLLYNNKFYGMTGTGGTHDLGTVFSYDPGSKLYTKIVDFDSSNGGNTVDFAYSLSAYNDKLYGMTPLGGANNAGVLFEYDPSSNAYTKKIDFDSATGAQPSGTLLPLNGKLYGVTYSGGANSRGVLFEYDPSSNSYTDKVDFQPPTIVGGGILSIFNGKIYGLWPGDGSNYAGSIFQYDPATNIYQKKIDLDTLTGKEPFGGLLLRNNLFYGITSTGGSSDRGVVFEYNPVTNGFKVKANFDSSTAVSGAYPGNSLISIPAEVADGILGTCQPLPAFSINNTNNSAWMGITDQYGNAVAELNPNGNNLGTITASLYVQNDPVRVAGGLNYLNRSLTISVQNQPAAGHPVGVRLYIKKSELDDLINTPGSGINSINDLVVYKSESACSDTIGVDVVKLTTTADDWGLNYVLTTQVTSFSTFHFSSANAALPISLLSFTAKRKNNSTNQLDWQTSSESNSQSFDIERSDDGRQFASIGNLPAAGMSSTKRQYQFIDTHPGTADNLYYRLKLVDNDGKYNYSNIVRLSTSDATGILISPNPVQNTLTMEGAGGFTQLQIIDASGRTVRQLPVTASGQYNVSDLKQGVYLVRLTNDKEVVVARFVKL